MIVIVLGTVLVLFGLVSIALDHLYSIGGEVIVEPFTGFIIGARHYTDEIELRDSEDSHVDEFVQHTLEIYLFFFNVILLWED